MATIDERVSDLCAAFDSRDPWGLQDGDVESLCLQHGFRVDVAALGMNQRSGTRISLFIGDVVYRLVRLSTGILRPIGTGSSGGNPVLVSLAHRAAEAPPRLV